jgi:ABC-type lipoprotein release transport system permease subunit
MSFNIFAKLAWRNVLRNKRRTLIAGTAIGLGLASMIYVDAAMIGMEANMIDSATASFMGEGQIHHEQYREAFEVEKTILNLNEVNRRLEADAEVEYFTHRTMAFGMISSPSNTGSVQMIGIDPTTEQHLSEIDDVMLEGTYFDGDDAQDVVIGRKLAELLEVELGDRIVMTTAQAHTGDLAQEMFRVSGIYYLNIAEMDQYMAFIRLGRAQQMLGLPDGVHQIALKFIDLEIGRKATHPLWARHAVDGNEAVGWTVLMPQLEKVFEMSSIGKWVLAVILFAIVALVIANSLFMSLYERMFEFGILRAVGTRPLAMGRLVVFEAGALAAISVVLGMVLGFILVALVAHYGVDYGGIEYEGVTFRKRIYPVLNVGQFIIYPVAAYIFTLIISLYPAAYAARLTPAKAMRKSF